MQGLTIFNKEKKLDRYRGTIHHRNNYLNTAGPDDDPETLDRMSREICEAEQKIEKILAAKFCPKCGRVLPKGVTTEQLASLQNGGECSIVCSYPL